MVNLVFAIANIVVLVTGVVFLVHTAWGIHTRGLGNTLAQPHFRLRWRFVLPLLGLLAFSTESYHSLRMNREFGTAPRRYYWWSFIRLDTDPMHRKLRVSAPCKAAETDCGWDFRGAIVDPGYYTESIVVAAFPAFVLGAITVGSLSHLGVNQVWSFGVSMPVYIFAWFYFLGWLIDRFLHRRRRPITLTPV